MKIICIVYGDFVTGPHGVSAQWDRIAGGFIPDAAVRTGPNPPVEPGC